LHLIHVGEFDITDERRHHCRLSHGDVGARASLMAVSEPVSLSVWSAQASTSRGGKPPLLIGPQRSSATRINTLP
jgi:hypothetical protein